MKIHEVQQGSEEWLEMKWGKLSGSRLAKLMTSKHVTDTAFFFELLSERLEDFDPFNESYQSKAMEHGTEYEPLARAEYERLTGETISQYGWIELDENIGISPDGWNESTKTGYEIKCPSAATHVKYMQNGGLLVEDYIWQIVMYFIVLDVEKVKIISYRPENKKIKMLGETVTKSTIVRISAKEELSVMELIDRAKARIADLFSEINKQVQ